MNDFRDKPKGDEIRVSLDSGANCDSRHDVMTDAMELGFESRAAWDAASDEEKMEAVQNYFYADGWPEWSWTEPEDLSDE